MISAVGFQRTASERDSWVRSADNLSDWIREHAVGTPHINAYFHLRRDGYTVKQAWLTARAYAHGLEIFETFWEGDDWNFEDEHDCPQLRYRKFKGWDAQCSCDYECFSVRYEGEWLASVGGVEFSNGEDNPDYRLTVEIELIAEAWWVREEHIEHKVERFWASFMEVS